MGDQKNQGNQGRPDQADRAGKSGEPDRGDIRKPGEGIEGMSERASNPQKEGDRNRQPNRETEQGRDK